MASETPTEEGLAAAPLVEALYMEDVMFGSDDITADLRGLPQPPDNS